jgi:uncharacterized protein (DUF1501 family)
MDTGKSTNRRSFLINSSRTGLAVGANLITAMGRHGLGRAGAFATSLAAMGGLATAAVSPADPYKALVCLFMFGGNDSHNWIYPFDTSSYNAYAGGRGGVYDSVSNPTGLALAAGSSGLLAPRVTDGRQFTSASGLASLRSLYDAGKMAVLANVGPLVQPTTKSQYQSGAWDLPPKLFSHNDQQSIWQASAPEGARYGWAGRMGDLLSSVNAQPVFTCVSATGNTVMLTGQDVVQYQVSTSGSVSMNGVTGNPLNSSTGAAQVLAALQDTGVTAIQAEYARIAKRARETDTVFKSSILADTNSFDAKLALPATAYLNAPTGHPGTLDADNLAQQLRIVAQIISKNAAIGAKRQVFMVSIGGFDTHDNHNREQSILMQRVAGCIEYFTNAINALGLANNVALFTASDFGRTLVSNGKGSDHGWGATHFIVGGDGGSAGAVKGRDIYGNMAPAGLGHDLDVGSGRLLPTTSVYQYAATLGKWFGLSASELFSVLPELSNFSETDLGFMR